VKLASLAAAVAGALRGRGAGDPAASLAAEAGIAVFKIAFERWVSAAAERPLAGYIDECAADLRLVTAAPD